MKISEPMHYPEINHSINPRGTLYMYKQNIIHTNTL